MTAHIMDKKVAYLVTGSFAALGICKIVKIALKKKRRNAINKNKKTRFAHVHFKGRKKKKLTRGV
jgi:hypothetical protein